MSLIDIRVVYYHVKQVMLLSKLPNKVVVFIPLANLWKFWCIIVAFPGI